MTAVCNGGTSSIKPIGTAALQVVSPDSLIDLFAGAGYAWLTTLAYGVGYLTFNLTNICAVDPPTLPNIDAGRLAGYVNPLNPLGAAQLREDATTIATYILWFLYCQCDTVQTPAPGPALPAPTGVTIDNPSNSQPSAGGCGQGGQISGLLSFDANGNCSPPSRTATGQYAVSHWFEIDTAFSSNIAPNPDFAYPVTTNVSVNYGTAAPLSYTFDTPSAGSRVITTKRFPMNLGAQGFTLQLHSPAPANTQFDLYYTIRTYCTDTPINAMQSCCPPDPSLMALLNQVLQVEQEILASLPQAKAPYVSGTVHGPVSGNGIITISPTAKAIRIDITQRPTSWPSGKTDPKYLFSIGFVTPYAVGTPLRGSRIVYDHQIYEWPTYTDQIAYALEPNVFVQLVELTTSTAPVPMSQSGPGT